MEDRPSLSLSAFGGRGWWESCIDRSRKPFVRLVFFALTLHRFPFFPLSLSALAVVRWWKGGGVFFSRRPPWFGRGWAASGPPASPGTGCASESGTLPWSRRRRARWCGSGTGGSCKRKPLGRKIAFIYVQKTVNVMKTTHCRTFP